MSARADGLGYGEDPAEEGPKTVTVKKTKQRVVVRTGNAPRKTRIRVRITSGGSGYSTTTWVRTWRVR